MERFDGSPGTPRGLALAARGLLVLAGLLGLIWSNTAGLQTIRAEAFTEVADRILRGERFTPGTLRRLLGEESGPGCPPGSELEARGILSYALTYPVLTSATFAERALSDVEAQAVKALACSPHNPLQWYMLFWARTQLSGLQSDHVPLLRLSYRLGRHEAWLQALRNPFAMRLYDDLPPELQAIVFSEYTELLNQGLYRPAAHSVASAPEGARERLRAAAERLPLNARQEFGRALEKLNLSVEITGVPDPEREQWQPFLDRIERLRSLGSGPGK